MLMEFNHHIILMDLSKQINTNNSYNYTKTYLYSIRIDGQEAIQLSKLEYKICLLLNENWKYQEIEQELSHKFSGFKRAFYRLTESGIVDAIHKSNDICIISPCDQDLLGIRNFPRTIVWNITNKCNLSCRHCIEKMFDNKSNDVKLDKYKIYTLLQEMDQHGLERLQISGGEPLVSPYFADIIRGVASTSICLDIFTNATCISQEQHKLLKETIRNNPQSITFHISLDGDEVGHNYLRRNNMAYKKTTKNIKTIMSYGGKVNVETVLHKQNINNLEALINNLIDLNVKYVYIHPMFNTEDKNAFNENELTKEERMECFKIIHRLRNKYSEDIVISYIDSYFPIVPYFLQSKIGLCAFSNNKVTSTTPINCMAGLDKMFINNEGEVYPCLLYNKSRRDYCGNIMENTLMDLWKSEGMKFVREPIYESMLKCSKCSYNNMCSGKVKGCRRGIEILTGDYRNIMPICEELFVRNELKSKDE